MARAIFNQDILADKWKLESAYTLLSFKDFIYTLKNILFDLGFTEITNSFCMRLFIWKLSLWIRNYPIGIPAVKNSLGDICFSFL